jgi:patatin-like phospholipase/acyl hydrolase
LDGGGAKGFYTLGVLHEIEALLQHHLKQGIHQRFDLIFGTSTGAIIAALLALGKPVDEVHALYRDYVPEVMRALLPSKKSAALKRLSGSVFSEVKFDAVKTRVGIVATRWLEERPMIFKNDLAQAHGQQESFVPGFGVTVSEAVQASCSAYPFFKRKIVTTSKGERVELFDGGFCANNPTLYALADATVAMKIAPQNIRMVSVGVGEYPTPKRYFYHPRWWFDLSPIVRLLQKTLEVNTQSMNVLRHVLFKHIQTIRVNDKFMTPELATDRAMTECW